MHYQYVKRVPRFYYAVVVGRETWLTDVINGDMATKQYITIQLLQKQMISWDINIIYKTKEGEKIVLKFVSLIGRKPCFVVTQTLHSFISDLSSVVSIARNVTKRGFRYFFHADTVVWCGKWQRIMHDLWSVTSDDCNVSQCTTLSITIKLFYMR